MVPWYYVGTWFSQCSLGSRQHVLSTGNSTMLTFFCMKKEAHLIFVSGTKHATRSASFWCTAVSSEMWTSIAYSVIRTWLLFEPSGPVPSHRPHSATLNIPAYRTPHNLERRCMSFWYPVTRQRQSKPKQQHIQQYFSYTHTFIHILSSILVFFLPIPQLNF